MTDLVVYLVGERLPLVSIAVQQLRYPLGAAHQPDGGRQVAVLHAQAGRSGRRRGGGRRGRRGRGGGRGAGGLSHRCRLGRCQDLLYGERGGRHRRPPSELSGGSDKWEKKSSSTLRYANFVAECTLGFILGTIVETNKISIIKRFCHSGCSIFEWP